MPSFGGWMFLLDICCQLLEKIWTWRSFRWLTRRWQTLSTSRWLKSFVRLNFNPSHIDQWMRMSVSNSHRGQATSLWRQLPVIVKVKVWRHKTLQFWGFLLGESTYFIGFMLPTFGIICKLGGFCGPFGPRVWKFAFFDIILLKLKYLPLMSCDIEGRRLWGQIFVMYSVHYKYLPSMSSALNVA